jgi:hypothetical protein
MSRDKNFHLPLAERAKLAERKWAKRMTKEWDRREAERAELQKTGGMSPKKLQRLQHHYAKIAAAKAAGLLIRQANREAKAVKAREEAARLAEKDMATAAE